MGPTLPALKDGVMSAVVIILNVSKGKSRSSLQNTNTFHFLEKFYSTTRKTKPFIGRTNCSNRQMQYIKLISVHCKTWQASIPGKAWHHTHTHAHEQLCLWDFSVKLKSIADTQKPHFQAPAHFFTTFTTYYKQHNVLEQGYTNCSSNQREHNEHNYCSVPKQIRNSDVELSHFLLYTHELYKIKLGVETKIRHAPGLLNFLVCIIY